jgi:hypothetical protein
MFSITFCPCAREKSPVWEAMIFMSAWPWIACLNPSERSRATDEPAVPVSSTMPALPFVCLISHSAARLPCSTKFEPRNAT